MKKQSGFSLLEIMVVLVIIGMIMAIVAPNIMGQQEEAKIDKARIDISALEDAMNMYKLKKRRLNLYQSAFQKAVLSRSYRLIHGRAHINLLAQVNLVKLIFSQWAQMVLQVQKMISATGMKKTSAN